MRALLLLAFISGPSLAATAGDLGRLLEGAVHDNPALRGAVLDQGVADAQWREAVGLEDFQAGVNALWTSYRRPPIAGVPLQQTDSDDASLSLQLSRPLPWGGQFGIAFAIAYNRARFLSTDGTASLVPSVSEWYTPSLTLTFTQPLARGLRLSVARAPRQRAQVNRGAATARAAAVATAVIRDLSVAYWEFQYALHERTIRRKSLDLARHQLEVVQANIEVGKQAPSASAEVEVAVGLREEDLLMAESNVQARWAEVARLSGDARLPLPPQDQPRQVGDCTDSPDADLDVVKRDNPDAVAARAAIPAAEIDVLLAENGVLPRLDVTASGGPIGGDQSGSTALGQMIRFQSYASSVGIASQFSLEHRAELGARDEARLRARQSAIRAGEVADAAVAAARAQLAQLASAKLRAHALDRSLHAAALDLESERARFEVGRSTNFDVLRRQAAMVETELHLARARVDCRESVVQLSALEGRLLQRVGIRWREGR